ncbi:hypothetical protein [Thermodesulfitimonas autotrophica]|uniref:hypothetical protein n=1 Tax=Thermodesulfitimonas autotrophica TaxID=1894989 RepID=UPI002FE030F0
MFAVGDGLNRPRSALYGLAYLIGGISAVRKGTVGRRLVPEGGRTRPQEADREAI